MNHHLAESVRTWEDKIEESRRLAAGVTDTIRRQRDEATPLVDALAKVNATFDAMYMGNVKDEDIEPPTTVGMFESIPKPRGPYADACESVTSDED